MDALVEINGNLLREPEPTADLEQLARELNELAHVRQNARVAFCRRLAAAYLLIVGKKARTVIASACPFCGKKYPSSKTQAVQRAKVPA